MMYILERVYKIVTILDDGMHTSTFIKRAGNLSGAKRYATSISAYPCKVQIFTIINPQSPEDKWIEKLLATRTIRQEDIDYGISSKTAKWKKPQEAK